ncbi:MAG: 2-oxo acid dehydrogenase subunit E2 [Clostridia bacterium]|nr:2-oxo acid dehydrogenase subunit E2 [Clostridia bacterium]
MGKVIIMPKLGYTQEEGQLVEWHKKEGEHIEKGEPFFDVLTDKSVITVEAAESGTILRLIAQQDDTLPVFTPIAVIGEPGEDADALLKNHVMDVAPDAPVDTAREDQTEERKENDKSKTDAGLKLTPKARKLIEREHYDPESLREIRGTGYEGGITAKDIKASPLARLIAEDNDIDLKTVTGTGISGRIMKKDVLQAVEAMNSNKEQKILYKIPYAGVRKIIGQRLAGSKFTSPHLYFSESIDTTSLSAFRKTVNDIAEVKVKVSDLLIMAVGKALQKYPDINASLQNNEIICYESVNIGVAVAGEKGLIVPVVRNVQDKTLLSIARETEELVGRAKKGNLLPQEYSGGTFTISNLGMFGIEKFTAIINPPESAILAVSSVRKKPVVMTGQDGKDEIAIRPMMNVTLSVDHRIIDGLLAASFVEYLKKLLENPLLLVI